MATKYSARLTTRFIDRSTPEFTGASRKLTAQEIVEEYRDLKRGGTFVGVEAIGADGTRVSIGDLEEMVEDDDAEDEETHHRIILDNGGGIILQLGAWAHSYDGSDNASIAKQAARDIREWLTSGTTSRWEGHDADALAVSPTSDEIRNGGYRVIAIDRDSDTAASLADEVRWGAAGEALGDALADRPQTIEELTSGTGGERITTEKFRIVCRGTEGPEGPRYNVIGHQLPDGRFLTIETAPGQGDDLWESRDAYAPNGNDEIESITSIGMASVDASAIENAAE